MKSKIIKKGSDFALVLLSSDDVLKRWDILKRLVESSFVRASYNGTFKEDDPIIDTYNEIKLEEPLRNNYKHLFALEKSACEPEFDESADFGEVFLGVIFSVPVLLPKEPFPGCDMTCETGWFTTDCRLHPPEHKQRKYGIAHALIETHHEIMKDAGFKIAEVEMGTKAGGAYWIKNFGYRHEPVTKDHPWSTLRKKDPNNRYIKEL